MQITVYEVLEYLASDMTEDEILDDFPDLTRDDVKACIAFATDREHRLITPRPVNSDVGLRGSAVTSMSLSVLQMANDANVRAEPFPYLVLRNALPVDLYTRLEASFPAPASLGFDEAKNNFRWDYHARLVKSSTAIPALWKDFIAYHVSANFFLEIVEVFYEHINRLYPRQFPSLEMMKAMRVGLRGKDNFRSTDVLMDSMISGNTPVRSASSVRTTHVDAGRKLFSGMFYMRRDEDDSTGGDLTLSRFKPRYDLASQLNMFRGAYVEDKHLEVVETVKYSKNTLVLFINSPQSLHGVTIRQQTLHNRNFVNFVGEVNPRLYRLSKVFHGPAAYSKMTRPPELPRPPVLVDLYQRLQKLWFSNRW